MKLSLELRVLATLVLFTTLTHAISENNNAKFLLNKHHIPIDQIDTLAHLEDVHVKFKTLDIGSDEITLVLLPSGDLEARKGYNIELGKGEKECAAGSFTNSINKIGWDKLNIRTKGNCGSLGSFFAAGWIEGYLTGYQIEDYLHDLFQTDPDEDYDAFRVLYADIYNATKIKAEHISHHEGKDKDRKKLWGTIVLFIAQFQGIYSGAKVRRPQADLITLPNLLLLNSNGEKGEIMDILPDVYGDNPEKVETLVASFLQLKSSMTRKNRKEETNLLDELYLKHRTNDPKKLWMLRLMDSHCSVLFKLIRDKENKIVNVIGSHGTWDDFTDMLKIVKSYDLTALKYQGSEGEKHSRKLLFPSYPGCITSQDDFYVNDNGLVVTETTIDILDRKIYDDKLKKEDYFPSFFRLSVANFLGKDAEEWTKWFGMINTGTYNSQWMLLNTDLVGKAFSSQMLFPKTFWVLEQIPGNIKVEDLTDTLNDNGYWSSYNIPYFPEHYQDAGYDQVMSLTHSDEYSYEKTPRRILFDQLQKNVNNVDDMMKVIRFNNWDSAKIDEADESNTQQDPGDTIAARYDILDDHDLQYYFGETDAKVIDYHMAKSMSFKAVSGPTHGGNLKPFKFPDDIYAKLKGIPQEYKFKWELFTFNE